MENTLVRRIQRIRHRYFQSVARLVVSPTTRIQSRDCCDSIPHMEESHLSEAERFALQHLDCVRAEKLRRILVTTEIRRREENRLRETAFRRARETSRRMHVATGFDAAEHFSLVGARIAQTAERIGELLGAYIDKVVYNKRRISEIVRKG